MNGFDEVRFPRGISHNLRGGPRRRTEVVTLGSGAEERNAVWQDSKREYNAGYGVKTLDDIHAVIAFWEARNAGLRGFRLWDPIDYKSCPPLRTATPTDQPIGTGDGTKATFQLVKVYSSGDQSWTRVIKKPVAGTVHVAVDGAEKTLGVDFTVDITTGIVTFFAGHIPGPGAAVTAAYEFDVPVRFKTDAIDINLSNFRAGTMVDIPLIEDRL